MVKRIREDHSNEDVNGHPLSDDARTKRIAALALCLAQRDALEEASPSEKRDVITRAIELCDRLGARSNEVDVKKEAFLCITCSGLLLLCVDVALKAIEEWSFYSSSKIVKSADRLLTLEYLEGAEGVTLENWKRCDEFVERFMLNHHLPVGLGMKTIKLFSKWRWYVESDNDRNLYFERYVLESLKEDAIAKIAQVYEYSSFSGREVVEKLTKALNDHNFEEGSSEESSDEALEDE